MILSLLISALAFAAPVERGEPLARTRTNLQLLERRCEAYKALEENGKGLGACEAPFREAVGALVAECGKMHGTYAATLPKAEALVREAVAWRKRKSMVRDDGRTVSISFSLSSDPAYPFHRSDKLVNDALAAANLSLGVVGEKMRVLEKGRACRGRAAKAAVAKLLDEWYAKRAEDGPSQFHNALGVGISDYLIGAQRAVEAGAFEEAQRGLEEGLRK